jgi:hypothetical protein
LPASFNDSSYTLAAALPSWVLERLPAWIEEAKKAGAREVEASIFNADREEIPVSMVVMPNVEASGVDAA